MKGKRSGGSGWKIISIDQLKIWYIPDKRAKGLNLLPWQTHFKKYMLGLVNIQNIGDDACFKWCMI